MSASTSCFARGASKRLANPVTATQTLMITLTMHLLRTLHTNSIMLLTLNCFWTDRTIVNCVRGHVKSSKSKRWKTNLNHRARCRIKIITWEHENMRIDLDMFWRVLKDFMRPCFKWHLLITNRIPCLGTGNTIVNYARGHLQSVKD